MSKPQIKPSSPDRPTPKPGIMDIKPYVPGKSAAEGAQRIIKLASNENPLGPSPSAIRAFVEAAGNLNRYPDGGATQLREAIGKAFELDPDRIVCGAGSDELIGLLMHAYAGAGDEVLYTEHGFLMYKIYAQGFGVTPVAAPEKNLTADVDALLAAVSPRTKIVFIANPNNPTGSYISRNELARLREGLRPDILLALDAAYAEYVEKDDYTAGIDLVDRSENTVMLRTFSKIYGLPALRLGWAYCPAHIADVLNRIRGPFNVATPALRAGIEAINDADYTDACRAFNTQWLAWVSAELTKLGMTVHPSVGNFVLVEFAAKGKHTAAAANAYLMARGIIPREVSAYGLPNHLRITIGTAEENRACVAALAEFLSV